MILKRLVWTPTIALALLGLLAVGCAALRGTAVPALPADYRAALAPAAGPLTAEMAALSQYSITVTVDPAGRAYTGSLELDLPISSSLPLRDLYFRLYPNLRQFGGQLAVSGALVNGRLVNFSYDAAGTAVHLGLATPLKPGSRARVGLRFNGKIPVREPDATALFGMNADLVSLPGFYPILAERRAGEWALEVANPPGDAGFHAAAWYRVQVSAPADLVIAAPGVVLTRTVSADGWATTRYGLGPAREFALVLSPAFQIAEAEAYGTRVRSYFLPSSADGGRLALDAAVTALQIYSDRYGAYPYREFNVTQAPLGAYGLELPGLSLIGNAVYGRQLDQLEALIAHEVAHQWWYNQVGNDQTRAPWLDEGLAEYSLYEYMLARYGVPAATTLRQTRWDAPLGRLGQRVTGQPIGRPAAAYNATEYEAVVYWNSARFFLALRDELGERAFSRLLRAYAERYRWRIAAPAEFRALAEEIAGRKLDALFTKWVGQG